MDASDSIKVIGCGGALRQGAELDPHRIGSGGKIIDEIIAVQVGDGKTLDALVKHIVGVGVKIDDHTGDSRLARIADTIVVPIVPHQIA